jgi:O-antigen/teichoic acid export membrane protein
VKGFVSSATIRSGTATLIDQGVVSATNFITGVLIGRSCAKEEFGLYMLGLSILMVASDLQASLIATPYMIHYPHLDAQRKGTYTGSTLVHQAALSIIMVCLLLLGGGLVHGGFGPREAEPVLGTLVTAGLLIMFREYVRRMCFAHLRMNDALVVDTAVSVLQLAGIAAFAYFGLLNAVRSFAVIGLAGCIVAGFWLASNRGMFVVDRSRIVPDLKENWSFGRWVFLSGLLWSLSMQLYPWVLTVYHGAAATGVWAACLGVANLANPVMLGVQNYLGPKIARVLAERGPRALGRFTVKSTAVFAALMLPFTLAALLFGSAIITLVYGGKYAGAGAVIGMLGLNLAAQALAFPVSRALFAARRADLDCAVNLVTLIFMFTAGLWLVRRYGATGAAAGLLAANILATLVRTGVFMKLAAGDGIRTVTTASE